MLNNLQETAPYYEHQKETLDFIRGRVDDGESRVFDASDPGTGKTRPAIGAFVARRKTGGGKALVLAPKSILQPAWGNDISRFFPGTKYICAYASNRKRAFEMDVDIYITNHDAVTWLIRELPARYWADFDTIIIDESTAYKNSKAKRSKAAYQLAKRFKHREILTGTPNPNSVTEFWHQVKLLDDGESLGTSFWKFRSIVCEPVQVGPSTNHIQWKDKPGAEHAVYDMIEHMTIRHEFAKCRAEEAGLFGDPYKIYYNLPLRASKQYNNMVDVAVTMLNDGSILSATQASAVHQKLMQLASGAVYKDDGTYSVTDTGRYELIMDLVNARKQCVVAFQWRHQRDELVKAAKKYGFSCATIDGSSNDKQRMEAVEHFQAGKCKVIFAHPQSAGHGLTLTAGTTTIWASPTYNSEHYTQFNARINRAGQTEQTETILVCAANTVDEKVYDRLESKLSSMQMLLDLLGDENV